MSPSIPILQKPFPFELFIENSPLYCQRLLRAIPEDRVLIVGEWKNKPVLAKIFLKPHLHGWRNFRRELRGTRALFSAQILTPNILYAGRLKSEGIFILLFEFLQNATEFSACFEKPILHLERLALLRSMVQTVARQHQAGLLQADLHLKNFLCVDNKLYSVDTGSFQIQKKPLSLLKSLKSLALLLAQFPSIERALKADMVTWYLQLRGFPETSQELTHLERQEIHWQKKREKKLCSKLFRSSTLFKSEKTSRRFWICNRHYLTDELHAFLDAPEYFFSAKNKQVRMIKEGNTTTVAAIQICQQWFLVKRYNVTHFGYRLKRWFTKTRAAKSWKNAHRLCFRGIPTPTPVAMIEDREGFLKGTSYFICEYINATTASDYFRPNHFDLVNGKNVAQQILQILEKLAHQKICHRDLKATNILISDKGISLVDLDGMRFYRTQYCFSRWAKKDMVRFMRNWQGNPTIKRLFDSIKQDSEKVLENNSNSSPPQKRKQGIDKLVLFLATGFGAGCLPLAPGTMGTLISIPVYFVLQAFSLTSYGTLLILSFLVGVWLCGKASRLLGVADPPSIVWDEMVGFWLTMFAIPFSWLNLLLGFLAFRFFDIQKPWPIRWVDKNVHDGLGIMLDDVLAAVYANIFLQMMCKLIERYL